MAAHDRQRAPERSELGQRRLIPASCPRITFSSKESSCPSTSATAAK
jgi:hypothetical protein